MKFKRLSDAEAYTEIEAEGRTDVRVEIDPEDVKKHNNKTKE